MKLHNQSSKKFWAPSLTLRRFWLQVSVSVLGRAPRSRCKNIFYSLKCDFETRLYLLSLGFCRDVFSDKSVSSEFRNCQCWAVEDNSCHFHRSFSVRCLSFVLDIKPDAKSWLSDRTSLHMFSHFGFFVVEYWTWLRWIAASYLCTSFDIDGPEWVLG